MSTPNVLIKDGHPQSADHLENVPDLSAFLASNIGDAVRLDNAVDLKSLAMHLPKLSTILVEFPAFADGRGFSIARELRKKYGFKGLLIADGPLIPDQYVFALQCGFDGVKVDGTTFGRQSGIHWFNAMNDFGSAYQRGYTFKTGPSVSIFDARATSDAANASEDPYFGLSAEQALARAIAEYEGDLVLASSMGVDSAVLLHMVAQIDRSLPIVFLDTGKHFRETLQYRDRLVSQLGLTNLINVTPGFAEIKEEDPDGGLHLENPDQCCDLRKVRPLGRTIEKYAARITGRKRYQTPDRKNMPILEVDGIQAKVNPLAYWSAKDVTGYMRKYDLPPHPLLALGFLSIGCQPCTTRVSENEDPRAGRWRNSEKRECGIHFVDGKWVPIEEKSTFEVF